MHHLPKFIVKFWRVGLALVAVPLLFTSCGGGGGSSANTPNSINQPGGSANAPKTLIGGVMVMNYGDSRAYTFTFNSSAATGVSRSDGKTSTNWTATGYGATVMTIDIAYGAFTTTYPDNLNNVFDDYTLTFDTKTTGQFILRENTTSNTYNTTMRLSGTFTFTTYPPGG